MDIKKSAIAGTSESSDCLVSIEKGDGKIEISIDSVVINQYGDDIKKEVLDTLNKLNVTSAKVNIMDRGALPYVLRARIETAVCRAGEV